MKRSNLIGHVACFVAYAIFGINIIVCKDLTSSGLISPIALFTLRSIGAGLLFWLLTQEYRRNNHREDGRHGTNDRAVERCDVRDGYEECELGNEKAQYRSRHDARVIAPLDLLARHKER